MACTIARGEERLQSLDSAQDADQALLLLSLPLFLSPPLFPASLLAASSLPVVTAIACAVMNHLTFSIPHSARHTLFSFPHFLTLLGQKIAIYTSFACRGSQEKM